MARGASEALAKEAARLRRRAGLLYPHSRPPDALPALLFVTDPWRTPDPVAVAQRLPRGAGVVFRGFGRTDAGETAAALARIARARGLVLLVGVDAGLAAAVGAQGVHLPERLLHLAPRLKRAHPGWRITGAAHGAVALKRTAWFGLDAALLSPVFASASASAEGVRPLGPVRFAALSRGAGLPVYALGGITPERARRLAAAAGLAAVDALGADAIRT